MKQLLIKVITEENEIKQQIEMYKQEKQFFTIYNPTYAMAHYDEYKEKISKLEKLLITLYELEDCLKMTIAILEKCYKYLKDYYNFLRNTQTCSDNEINDGYDEGLKRLIHYLEELVELVRNF